MAGDPKIIHARGAFDRTMFASITGVNTTKGTVSIVFNDQFGFRDDVPMPVVAMSRDSWIRFIPQINDVVHVGIRGDDSAVILGWHPWSYKARVDAFNSGNVNAAGGKGPEMMQELKQGEIDMRAVGGGYLRFNALGDVLLMSLAGRIQMFGVESLTECSQNAFKITDGQSWMRFGSVMRLFSGVSERELPSTGAGTPSAAPTSLRERDTRLYGPDGQLLVQESLGTVVDDNGLFTVSGTSGNGSTVKFSTAGHGQNATAFFTGDPTAFKNSLASSLSGLSDAVKEKATASVNKVKSGVSAVVAGIASSDTGTVIKDVLGLADGSGGAASGTNPISGLGVVGRLLRYRLLVNKGSDQAFAVDVDEAGGTVLSSQDDHGISINANVGSLLLYGKKAVKQVSQLVMLVADNIYSSSAGYIKQVSGGNNQRVAGGDIIDNGNNVKRTAQVAITDHAATSITEQSDGTITIQAGSSLSATGSTISVSATGAVTITGGTVSITASGIVTITGATVEIN